MSNDEHRHVCGICNYPIRPEDDASCVVMPTGEHAHPLCAKARPQRMGLTEDVR